MITLFTVAIFQQNQKDTSVEVSISEPFLMITTQPTVTTKQLLFSSLLFFDLREFLSSKQNKTKKLVSQSN